MRAMALEDYKVIDSGSLPEIYDLNSDLTEQNNLVNTIAPDKRSKWVGLMPEIPQKYFARKAGSDSRRSVENLSQEEQDSLRALGYLE